MIEARRYRIKTKEKGQKINCLSFLKTTAVGVEVATAFYLSLTYEIVAVKCLSDFFQK
jgi:hypothetical protein